MNDTKTFVLDLQDCSEENRAEVGTKALGLHNLLKAGVAVPSGFCITTSAFKHLLGHNDVLSNLVRSLEEVHEGGKQGGSSQKLYQEIRQGILVSPLDENLSSKIANVYRKVVGEGRPVAVRPSAMVEDTGTTGLAGHHGTFLNISSEGELIAAIKKVWANQYIGVATGRKEGPSVEQSLGMAVVVQSMIRAVKSGVMFTANPSTMDRSMVLIEAASGSGEAFVYGDPTHDQYFVNKVTYEIEKKVLPQKAEASKPSLSQAEVNSLVEVGKLVEKGLRRSQEIGWVAEAVADKAEGEVRFFFIGSRPIASKKETKPASSADIFSLVTSAVNRRVRVG